MGIDTNVPANAVRVLPGEFFATDQDVAIVTVLGSCVAACIRDAGNGIGGMNHFMLPRERREQGPASGSARYGVHAMELLINRLARLGARRQHLEAKVFGGGNVLAGCTALNVGQANAEFVGEFLRAESIRVTASDLQGTQSRKVCFFPATGRVLVRSIQNAQQHAIAERETKYVAGLNDLPVGGDVEFFR